MANEEAAVGLSPGPLRMSDLDPSSPGPMTASELRLPPRRLEPISPVEKKTKKKRTKKAAPTAGGDSTVATGPIMGELDLNQLRARLDPIYNPPPPVPPLDLETTMNDTMNSQQHHVDVEVVEQGRGREKEGGLAAATEVPPPKSTKRKRTRKSRRREVEGDSELARPETETPQEEGGVSEQVPRREGEEGPPPQLEESLSGPSQGTRQGRQLPAFPSAAETPSLADQLAQSRGQTQGFVEGNEYSQHDDPQFLVTEEDIVEEVGEVPPSLLPAVSAVHHPTSQPRRVIFVERRDGRGFLVRRKGAGSEGEEGDEKGETPSEREISSAEFALYAHKAMHLLAVSAHGLVAGISLWDCVVSNVLSRQENRHLDLLQHYNPLTLPVHAVYVFLLSLVVVSLFDRFDFARMDKQCLEGFVRTPTQIALFVASFLVFLALVVTLSVAAIDERIALYPNQPTLWSDLLTAVNTSTLPPSQDPPLPTTHTADSLVYVPGSDLTSSRLTPWLALAILRAICCAGSWLLLQWIPHHDRLQDYLCEMAEKSAGQSCELHTGGRT